MKFNIFLSILLFISSATVAGTAQINGKKLSKVRAVGDYPGTTYDNSVELWFTQPITWPSEISCSNTSRVYIDVKNTHMISAAYMALASGATVNFYADDRLPNRNGSCEISFLDVIK